MAKAKEDEPITEAMKDAAEAEILDKLKRIDFYLSEFTIDFLASQMMAGEFVVPAYQREFTWEESRKSRFIESVLMGLPIPFLFFWEMPDGRLEIVDGSQRLRTLQEWIHGGFKLGQLEELPSVSGFGFTDLHTSRQRKVRNRSIRGIVLNEQADDQSRFDMFERINTGSKAANKAEVRRGALGGPFVDLVIKLASDKNFAKLAPVPEKAEAEREREELITRFFAYSDGLEGYKDRPAKFLYDYTRAMNARFEADPALLPVYEKRFKDVIEFVGEHSPLGFRKTKTSKTSPRARFEALAVGSAVALAASPDLLTFGPRVPMADWINGAEFTDATTSDGANVVSKLRGRIQYVANQLLA